MAPTPLASDAITPPHTTHTADAGSGPSPLAASVRRTRRHACAASRVSRVVCALSACGGDRLRRDCCALALVACWWRVQPPSPWRGKPPCCARPCARLGAARLSAPDDALDQMRDRSLLAGRRLRSRMALGHGARCRSLLAALTSGGHTHHRAPRAAGTLQCDQGGGRP